MLAILSSTLFFPSQSNSKSCPNHREITLFYLILFFLELFLYALFYFFLEHDLLLLLFFSFFFNIFSLFGVSSRQLSFLLCFPSHSAHYSLSPIQINTLFPHLVFWFCYKLELEGQVRKIILGSVKEYISCQMKRFTCRLNLAK